MPEAFESDPPGFARQACMADSVLPGNGESYPLVDKSRKVG
jgi:hypothetical protein